MLTPYLINAIYIVYVSCRREGGREEGLYKGEKKDTRKQNLQLEKIK